ncbi:TadE/TadG family type IV pilus assembly protein [Vibrio europaeus]|uniref:TadE/TadG family type IV pilus assembly protein n=1 Tax=Vibrio europaeus TaxID=300876 RepID=UPI00233EC638|nr:TadE family protein [Vibrio europaeus]MDC5856840.1 pilus assembly protein [Vibrio europaeus]
MRKPLKRRQKGVFAIEFALGFIVLFMFTMLIFETCRLTYICSVLDYATAEAARDARVQLKKNKELSKYNQSDFDCTRLKPDQRTQCEKVQSFNGDEFQIWFYSFMEQKRKGVLGKILSFDSSMAIDSKHYKNRTALVNDQPNASDWKKNAFSIFEVHYFYRPVFFPVPLFSTDIKRHVLVIDEFERHRSVKK